MKKHVWCRQLSRELIRSIVQIKLGATILNNVRRELILKPGLYADQYALSLVAQNINPVSSIPPVW